MTSISLVNAQDSNLTSNDPPYYCPNKSGAFYQANLFPRYDIASKSLVLIDDTNNQAVRTLDTFPENVRIINWSPDCRYLTGVVGDIESSFDYAKKKWIEIRWKNKDIVLWDASSGGRVQSFPNDGIYIDYLQPSPVEWSPDSNYALILGGCYSEFYSCLHERVRSDFMWQRSSNLRMRVGKTETLYYDRSWFNQYYWDMKRGWLWGSGEGGVSAYDVNTGVEVRFFQNNSWTESRFVFSADNNKVVTYSVAQPGSGGNAAITVYDIDSQASVSVNVEGFAAPDIALATYDSVALSADNHYLTAGYDAIRVWDIQNLPEKVEDRLPIYRYAGPKALIWSLRFSDAGVIETNSKEGIQHWDLHTGQFLAD
ncbi:MAG: hypothetical protein H0X30_00735 [Anaerolineae bacterium]|nr:hypothetical protein [Anaerolineae bacterium]